MWMMWCVKLDHTTWSTSPTLFEQWCGYVPQEPAECKGCETGPTYCILLFFTAVFGTDPDMTREGGSIPVTLTLQEATEKNVVLLPLGACDDGAHSQNEKMDRKNYIEGVSIFVIFNDDMLYIS